MYPHSRELRVLTKQILLLSNIYLTFIITIISLSEYSQNSNVNDRVFLAKLQAYDHDADHDDHDDELFLWYG